MRKFVEYFKKNQVEIALALYAVNMNVNSFQGYEQIRAISER